MMDKLLIGVTTENESNEIQTTEKSARFLVEPHEQRHQDTGQDNRRERAPVFQTVPAPSWHNR